MGRLSQVFDFLKRKPLPAPYEREFLYTKISEEEFLKRKRKELHLKNDNINDDSENELI